MKSIYGDVHSGLAGVTIGRGPLVTSEATQWLRRRVEEDFHTSAPQFVDVTGVQMEDGEGPLSEHTECALPPFSDCWVEWRDQGTKEDHRATVGVRVRDVSLRAEAVWRECGEMWDLRGPASIATPAVVLSMQIYVRINSAPRRQVGFVGSAILPADDEGRLLRPPWAKHKGEQTFVLVQSGHPEWSARDDIREELRSTGAKAANVVITTFSLLDSLNVGLRKSRSGVSRKQRRKGRRGLEWHRLVVVAPKVRREGVVVAGSQGDLLTRRHLCRGHFKAYTLERPLFGRYSGRFWWSPHVRGNEAQGVVLKDYELRDATEVRA